MEVTQIKDIVNNALTETLGTAELLNEDLTNIIDVGTNLYNAQAYYKNAKSLVNQVGKMIIVNRIYTGRMPSVLMDSWEFGSVVEKIRTQLPKASVTEDWQLEDGKSYDPHVFYKPDVSVKFFNSKTTFEVDRSITDLQIKQSFQSADQMNGFLSSLQTAVANALTVATENLIMRTINNMVGETLANEYKGDDNHFDETKLSTKSGVRAINLLHEYNDKFTKTLAANKCIYDPDFIRYASFRIGDTADLLSGMSCLYNVGGTEKFTPASKLHTVMLSMFAKSAGVYIYDANGIPIWPANVVNYTSKTQYIFRINKGCCDINDNKSINSYIKEEERPVPFSNMVFIGDGETDIPAMKMVKVNGGHSIAVYKPTKKDAKTKAKELIKDNRVNMITQADYQENSMIDKYIKALINKIEADYTLRKLEKKDN